MTKESLLNKMTNRIDVLSEQLIYTNKNESIEINHRIDELTMMKTQLEIKMDWVDCFDFITKRINGISRSIQLTNGKDEKLIKVGNIKINELTKLLQ
jgi:hypothetical protein